MQYGYGKTRYELIRQSVYGRLDISHPTTNMFFSVPDFYKLLPRWIANTMFHILKWYCDQNDLKPHLNCKISTSL